MTYSPAMKRISGPADMERWKSSPAYRDYVHFVKQLNTAVTGKKNSAKAGDDSAVILNLISMLNTMDKWIEEIPPITQPQRFGNQAFRTYHARLTQEAPGLVGNLLANSSEAAIELVPYFCDSFGNSTRIDYGTGHEANFVMFLCCLSKLGILQASDYSAAVLRVFTRYLTVCRHLQLAYKMEPAGSHGVWSLDDFQFLPFLWGSAQLIDHPNYDTRAFLDDKIVADSKEEYMWMSCIDFIGKVKTGPFAEHSNQLWSISAVPFWDKVNKGLIKMYDAEVLQKFPVAQHFLFGSLLKFESSG